MESASMIQLLKVGEVLFQKQKHFKKLFDVDYDFLYEEIKLLLHVILIHMGIIQEKANSIIVIDTDYYEYLTKWFWDYCKGLVSEEDMIDIVHALKIEGIHYISNGEPLHQIKATKLVNVLFRLKYSVQTKRYRYGNLISGDHDLLNVEKEVLNIALEELGKQRYF